MSGRVRRMSNSIQLPAEHESQAHVNQHPGSDTGGVKQQKTPELHLEYPAQRGRSEIESRDELRDHQSKSTVFPIKSLSASGAGIFLQRDAAKRTNQGDAAMPANFVPRQVCY